MTDMQSGMMIAVACGAIFVVTMLVYEHRYTDKEVPKPDQLLGGVVAAFVIVALTIVVINWTNLAITAFFITIVTYASLLRLALGALNKRSSRV